MRRRRRRRLWWRDTMRTLCFISGEIVCFPLQSSGWFVGKLARKAPTPTPTSDRDVGWWRVPGLYAHGKINSLKVYDQSGLGVFSVTRRWYLNDQHVKDWGRLSCWSSSVVVMMPQHSRWSSSFWSWSEYPTGLGIIIYFPIDLRCKFSINDLKSWKYAARLFNGLLAMV